MRKELVWAIVVGLIFGLVVAFGIWRLNSILDIGKGQKSVPKSSPTPTASFGLTINKPEDGSVITESKVTFSGITRPGTWVVISSADSDLILQTDSSGVFEKDIKLSDVINKFSITSLDANDGVATYALTLVYSTEFAKTMQALPTSSPGTSTQEGDIREKVQKKVQEALNNPKAYLGIVTDIAESTIQIKTASGEIRQVSVEPKDVTVIKSDDIIKEVKLSDIAIGDYIVAMGFRNGNGVLDTKRILITSAPSPLKVKAYLGKVSDINKIDLSFSIVQAKDNQALKITPAKGSKIRLSSLDQGDIVIVVGTKQDDGSVSARTLFKITPSPTPTATPTPKT